MNELKLPGSSSQKSYLLSNFSSDFSTSKSSLDKTWYLRNWLQKKLLLTMNYYQYISNISKYTVLRRLIS